MVAPQGAHALPCACMLPVPHAGLVLGGAFGFFEGLRASSGTRMRIRINGILNGCGRRGARTANSLGVMAVMCVAPPVVCPALCP